MNNNDQGIRAKIEELNQLAWDNRVNDSPESFKLSGQALELLRDVDYPKGKADALKCYGFALVRLSKNEEALKYLNEALSIFESLEDVNGLSVVYEYLGIVQRNWGNFSNSLILLKKALELSRQTGFVEAEGTTLYQTGVTYKYLGNYEQALDYYHQCLYLMRSAGFTLMEAYAINVIGAVYFEIQNYGEALHYYQQGLAIRQLSGDKWGEAGSLDNIGSVYLKLEDWEKALEYCERSLTISESTDDRRGQGNSLFHLAEIYKQQNNWDHANFLSGKSLHIRREMGDRKGESEILLLFAELKKSTAQSIGNSELDFLRKALNISDEIKAADLSGKAHWAMYKYYKGAQEHEHALTHLEIYDSIEKKLHKDAVNQKVLNFEVSQRAEASEKETEKFRAKNEELAKLNAEIKSQKEETEKALIKLKATQAQLIQSEKMASLGELTAGIAHEIQNPLNFVNNYAEVNVELLEELFLEGRKEEGEREEGLMSSLIQDLSENEAKILHHGKRADAIVRGMLQHSRRGSGTKEPTNLNALADEYLRLAYYGLRRSGDPAKYPQFQAEFITDFDKDLPLVEVIPQDMGRVLLNIINNAFQACSKRSQLEAEVYEPKVTVTTKRLPDAVELRIADNGNGIPEEIKDKIFQPFFTTKPTGQGTGLGLSLAYDLVTKGHGGTLEVESLEGQGSTFLLVLPLLG